MKKTLILLCFIAAAQLINAQKISNSDLVGTWEISDTSENKTTYTFTASFYFSLETPAANVFNMSMAGTYLFNSLKNGALLTFTSEEYGVQHITKYLIRIENNNVLKMQASSAGDPLKWEKESKTNTIVYTRKK